MGGGGEGGGSESHLLVAVVAAGFSSSPCPSAHTNKCVQCIIIHSSLGLPHTAPAVLGEGSLETKLTVYVSIIQELQCLMSGGGGLIAMHTGEHFNIMEM